MKAALPVTLASITAGLSLSLALSVGLWPSAAQAQPTTTAPSASTSGVHPFFAIHKVLLSPRCMNCHPQGNAPLQFDDGRPHGMNVTRDINDLGLACTTCHQSTPYNIPHFPPGAPHWGLPAADMPLVFEGKSVQALCEQMRDPEQNGHKTLEELLHHIEHDPLVLWGYNPGPGRTVPPLSHDVLVEATRRWVTSGGTCPQDNKPVPQLGAPGGGAPTGRGPRTPGQAGPNKRPEHMPADLAPKRLPITTIKIRPAASPAAPPAAPPPQN